MNKKEIQENLVLTEKYPDWLKGWISDEQFDKDLFQIFLFYVIFSPCPKYCTKGHTLQYYGWKEKPWSTNRYLKDKLDKNVFFERKKYFRSVGKIAELQSAFNKAELLDNFYENREVESVAFLNCESSEYISLFHHIRCSLAHGRFAVFPVSDSDDAVFVMENGVGKGNAFSVRARMILKKSTLLRWAKLISEGPQEDEKNYRVEIYKALLKNSRLRVKDLENMFNEPKTVIKKAMDFLKKNNIIEHHNHGENSWWEVKTENAKKCFEKLGEKELINEI